MLYQDILYMLAGLAIVVYGADEAIKRLLNLSRYFRISVFAAGVVIAGTLAVLPEMSIGIISALGGTPSFGLGVILGSNVADMTFVIGAVVKIAGGLKLNPATIRSLKVSFFSVTLPILLLIDGELSYLDGIILVFAFILYAAWLLRSERSTEDVQPHRGLFRFGVEAGLLVVGVTVLFIGSEIVTEIAHELNLALGLPLFLIGVVVSIGTCLPELAFSIRATEAHNPELGLGNILGNVLADSMLTIGVIAFIHPIKPPNLAFPISTGVFVIFSALLLVFLSRKGELSRRDGVILVLIYIVFLAVQASLEVLVR